MLKNDLDPAHAHLDEIYQLDLGVGSENVDPVPQGLLVSCDKLMFREIPGVHQVFGDVTAPEIVKEIKDHLGEFPAFDLVVSDIHPGASSNVQK